MQSVTGKDRKYMKSHNTSESQTCNIQKLVKKFEMNAMLDLSEGIVSKIKKKEFPKPEKYLLRLAQKDSESMSTTDSQEDQINQSLNQRNKSYDHLIRQRLAQGCKKIVFILEGFSKFEDRISEQLLTRKFDQFNSKLFDVFGACIENEEVFNSFSAFKLLIAIIYVASLFSEVKPKIVLGSLHHVFRTRFSSLSDLRKSSLVRRIITMLESK